MTTIKNEDYSVQYKYQDNMSNCARRLHIMFGLDDSMLEEVKKNDFDFLQLSYGGDWSRLAELDLENLNIKRITINPSEKQNLNWVSRIHSLESLSSNQSLGSKFDYEKLTNLKCVGGPYSVATERLVRLPLKLESLGMSSFKGSFSNFSDTIKNSLKLMNVSINKHSDICGIDELSKLNEFVISNSNWLVDISPLVDCSSLRTLSISSCNKIEYEGVLSKLTKLEKLVFENKKLKSATCLPRENLEYLSLGDQTVIEDRDVTKLLEFPKLSHASYAKKKGYLYSALELNELMEAKPKK